MSAGPGRATTGAASAEDTDAAGNRRYHAPDSVAVDTAGEHLLVEAKRREGIDLAGTDRAARLWCDNATRLTGTASCRSSLRVHQGACQDIRMHAVATHRYRCGSTPTGAVGQRTPLPALGEGPGVRAPTRMCQTCIDA